MVSGGKVSPLQILHHMEQSHSITYSVSIHFFSSLSAVVCISLFSTDFFNLPYQNLLHMKHFCGN